MCEKVRNPDRCLQLSPGIYRFLFSYHLDLLTVTLLSGFSLTRRYGIRNGLKKSDKCVTHNKTATVYCDVRVTGYKSTETHSTLKSEPQQLVYHSMGVFHMSHFPPIYLKPLGIQIHSCSF